MEPVAQLLNQDYETCLVARNPCFHRGTGILVVWGGLPRQSSSNFFRCKLLLVHLGICRDPVVSSSGEMAAKKHGI